MVNPEDLVIDIFHVGKGDSALVRFPGGKRYGVIDSNQTSWLPAAPAVKALKAIVEGPTKLAGEDEPDIAFVCSSHPHIDHVLGLKDILKIRGIKIKELWHPLPDVEEILLHYASPVRAEHDLWSSKITQFYYEDQLQEFVEFCQEIEDMIGIDNFRAIRGGMVLPDIEGVQIYALSPTHKFLSNYKAALERNYGRLHHLDRQLHDEISIALLFVYGKEKNSFLYASGIQCEQWKELVKEVKHTKCLRAHLPVGVMKASHHGGPRSYYDALWKDLLGKKNGAVVVSGGSMTHPCDAFIESVQNAEKELRCTGLARKCGRTAPEERKRRFLADTLLHEYPRPADDAAQPCYGDIRIVLPSDGPPRITPPRPRRTFPPW